LSKYLDTYSAIQSEHGYEQQSIRQQILVISDFSGWIKQNKIVVSSLDVNDVDRFLRLRQRQQRGRRGDPTALKRMLVMLREKEVVKRQVDASKAPTKVAAAFERYLLNERGLSPATLLNYVPVIERAVEAWFISNPLSIDVRINSLLITTMESVARQSSSECFLDNLLPR